MTQAEPQEVGKVPAAGRKRPRMTRQPMSQTSNHPHAEPRVTRQNPLHATQTNRPQAARQLHTPRFLQTMVLPVHSRGHRDTWLAVDRQHSTPQEERGDRPRAARKPVYPAALQWPWVARQTHLQSPIQVNLAAVLQVARQLVQPAASYWTRVAHQPHLRSPVHKKLAKGPQVAHKLAYQPAAAAQPRVNQQHPPQCPIR